MGLLTRLKVSNQRNNSPNGGSIKSSVLGVPKTRYSYTGNTKARQLSAVRDFFIDQEAPHKVWRPNEYICGEAVIVLKEDIQNIVIRLSLIGDVKIRGLGSRTRSDRLFEKTTLVYGDEENEAAEGQMVVNGLTKGEHRFPFRLKVPTKNIFTSIKFERGSISYCIRCTLEPLQSPQLERVLAMCEKSISVMVPLDVSHAPKPNTKTVVLQSPSLVKSSKLSSSEQDASSSVTKRTGGSRNSGSTIATSNSLKTVTINVDLPASGYAVGEVIPIELCLNHYKEYSHSTGLIATLVRICRVGDPSKEIPIETYRKDICQTVSPIYVNPETLQCAVTVYLKVPLDAFPTLRLPNRKFSFQYYVEVLVNLSRKNIAFTESNRVIDATINSNVSSSPEKSIKDTFTLIQRKMRSGSESESYKNKDQESMIFFNDLINVDKLKRLRNVTGMSIEVVVGTNRSQTRHESQEEQEVSQLGLNTPTGSPSNKNPSTAELYTYLGSKRSFPDHCNGLLNYDEDSMFPLPEYTPNSLYKVDDDKDEIELQRLRELESDPPLAA